MSSKLMLLALLPGILIIIYIFRKDKVEHEPWSLIIKLLVLGAVSCIPAMFLEGFVSAVGPVYEEGTVEFAVFEAFCVAGLCEEFCKYLLLLMGSWKNRKFDFRFDGIVYAVAVAVGFALLENVLYVAEGGISVAITRGLLAVPLHAFCGVFMGIFYGAAKRYQIERRKSKQIGGSLLAFLIPLVIHGIYDSLAFMGLTVPLLAFVVIMYFVAIKLVNRFSREDWHAGFYTQPLSSQPFDQNDLDGKNQR